MLLVQFFLRMVYCRSAAIRLDGVFGFVARDLGRQLERIASRFDESRGLEAPHGERVVPVKPNVLATEVDGG
jgi:hypothetical protein